MRFHEIKLIPLHGFERETCVFSHGNGIKQNWREKRKDYLQTKMVEPAKHYQWVHNPLARRVNDWKFSKKFLGEYKSYETKMEQNPLFFGTLLLVHDSQVTTEHKCNIETLRPIANLYQSHKSQQFHKNSVSHNENQCFLKLYVKTT